MLVLAGLWKLYTRKTSGALKKNPSERGNSMVWPTHEVHFRTAFHPPPMSNVASDSTKKLRFWYDNARFGRLVEVVDMEDLWDLEKKPFKTGKRPTHENHFQFTFQLPPMSNVASESTKKL